MLRGATGCWAATREALSLQQDLQAVQHGLPERCGVRPALFVRVVVLRQSHRGLAVALGELDRDGVVVLRPVRLAGERAVVGVTQDALRVDIENRALVFVAPALVLSFP